MSYRSQMHKKGAPNTELGLERILFFSDAVMAIAMTLLAIDLKVPEIPLANAAAELPAYLGALTPRVMSFVVSFVVVGIYWMSHHRYFSYIRRYDTGLIVLNLLFLLLIAAMPFVAGMLGRYVMVPLSVMIYAGAVALIGFTVAGLWWYASHNHRLVDETLDDSFIHARTLVALVVPALFLLSIPFMRINLVLAMSFWWVSPLVSVATQRLAERKPGRRRAVRAG